MRALLRSSLAAILIAAGASPLLLAQAAPTATKRLTLEQTVGLGERPQFGAQLPPVAWAADGKHLVVRGASGVEWMDPRTGERRKPDAPATEGTGNTPNAPRARGPRTPESADRRVPDASPDAKWVAFVRGNDLFVEEAASKAARPLTNDGGKLVYNGLLDWVYQEEVYGRGKFRAHWWSPDSKALAFLRLDETGVKEFTVVDHVPSPTRLDADKTVKLETDFYPKAGDTNPTVKLGIAPIDGPPIFADLSDYPADILIVRVGWRPDASAVVFQVQDRIQTWLDLCACDPTTGKVTKLFRETSDSWVNILEEPQWLADGSFLWLSERTGFKHLYHYEADGTLRRAITSGDWQVRDVLRVDEATGRIWFTATKDGAVDDNAYRTTFDGGEPVRLTQGRGRHRVTLNADGSMLLDTVSSLTAPPELRVCDADGNVLRVVETAKPRDLDAYGYRAPELIEIPARDGYVMDATILKPADFDPNAKYAIWLETYAGPDAPSVRNAWQADPWPQFLAQQGYIHFQVDNRSASGKGQKYTAACYKNFGKSELADIEDALAWLGKTYPWADTSRVGISGWSYGGTITAYALTHGKSFKLGVAGAGVYDWRLYDTIYTERYMDTPQNNPAGYRESSCIENAKNLHGHLVLVHGTMDENVHLQNAMQLAFALQKAHKDFEMMLYPKSRHGVGSFEQHWHLRRLTWRAIQQHLGGPIRS